MTLHAPTDLSGTEAKNPRQPGCVPIHDAQTLTQGGALANIVLSGQVYALRITRAGKLILTK